MSTRPQFEHPDPSESCPRKVERAHGDGHPPSGVCITLCRNCYLRRLKKPFTLLFLATPPIKAAATCSRSTAIGGSDPTRRGGSPAS